ncbi:potassium voltage-gated channel subfamily H member 6-like isoform X1 [Rhopilema esculentum]|uniref:potassium voltage-gated channel subfamily H member 6-like isoform X1 n=2 Tax=Rhopilema esculentum TaxID=499914 RepID=UPI0031DB9D95
MDSQEITSMLPGSSNCNKVSPQKKRTCRKGKEKRKKEKSEETMLSESFTKSNEVTGLFKSQNVAKSNPRLSPKRLFSLDVRSAARGRERYPLSVKSSSASNQSKKDKKCACIIPHNSNLKILWDWFVLILVLYTAVQIPYQAAFPSKHNSRRRGMFHSHSSPTSILGYVVDAMFLLDIFINFFTTFPESETEEIITDHRRIAVHYLKTWFAIDFIAVIPFDWFVDELRPDSEDTATLFGLLKSARLLRLFRVARKLDRYSEYGVAVLFLLMSLFTLLAHWLACIWHVIGDKQPPVPSGWLQVQATDLGVSSVNGTKTIEASVKYIASLYFILSSLTSVGFGNVSANTKYEQIFMIIVMLLGALMYATVFGNMVAIVQRLYSKASRFHNEMNIIKEFLRFYKIPEDLRRSIQTYVRQEWTFTEGVDVQKVLKQFPMSLQMDICYELYQGLFSEVRALQGATVSCMRTMGRKFRTLHLQVGHYVLKQGDQVEHLFVIGRGAMEVIKDGELSRF